MDSGELRRCCRILGKRLGLLRRSIRRNVKIYLEGKENVNLFIYLFIFFFFYVKDFSWIK